MKKIKRFKLMLTLFLVFLMALPPWVIAQGAQGTEGSKPFKQEELDQLVAPIALYPDDLLSQTLMASTYPLEVVQADRWVKQNKDLKGDALATALEKQPWDPSVKSLVNFPQVLTMMSEKLDWTQKLGDAFLAQQEDVMDTVQNLRAKAQAQGNLKTTKEQKVIVQEKIIIIEPASPQVIYVPTYNPVVVYGPWWWPAYPPYYYYPPGYVAGAALFSFGVGIAVGAAWGYAWGRFHWGHPGHHRVNININQNININRNINRNVYATQYKGGSGTWQHDVNHRKGVAYSNQGTAQKYNRGTTSQAAGSREAYRGRADQGGQALQQGRGTAGKGGQQASQQKAGGAGQEARQQKTGGAGQQTFQKGAGGATGQAGQKRKDSAFSGIESGKQTQNYSDRGSKSRSASGSPSTKPSGGATPGGGSSGGGFPSGGSSGGGTRGGGKSR